MFYILFVQAKGKVCWLLIWLLYLFTTRFSHFKQSIANNFRKIADR